MLFYSFFYYISQTTQLSDIKFSMQVYDDGVPIHAYFQVPTWFAFADTVKKAYYINKNSYGGHMYSLCVYNVC